jgi:acylphosphatase
MINTLGNCGDIMKMKVKITGSRVHGVGYRFHLLDLAIKYDIDRFSINRLAEGRTQALVASVEGNENQLNMFIESIEKEIPLEAEVSSIECERFDEYVSPIMATAWALMSKESS